MPDASPIQRILVPHDFSDAADRALALALDLAAKLGASVTVMHAYEIPSFGFPGGPGMSVEMAVQVERAARSALDGVASRARRPGVDVVAVLREGAAWDEILAVIGETKANLVVMGTHGRRGFARMLLGSVAEKVVRTSPCPVLTVHGPESQK